MDQIAPGLIPVWMTDNLDLTTTQPLPTNNRTLSKDSLSVYQNKLCTSLLSAKIGNLFLGVDPSDCPLPCRTFSTEVKFFSKLDELVGFGLFFLPTVEVDKVPHILGHPIM